METTLQPPVDINEPQVEINQPRGSKGSYDRDYYLKNREKLLKRSKEYYNKIKNNPNSYYERNKERLKLKRDENNEEYRKKYREYYWKNKAKQ